MIQASLPLPADSTSAIHKRVVSDATKSTRLKTGHKEPNFRLQAKAVERKYPPRFWEVNESQYLLIEDCLREAVFLGRGNPSKDAVWHHLMWKSGIYRFPHHYCVIKGNSLLNNNVGMVATTFCGSGTYTHSSGQTEPQPPDLQLVISQLKIVGKRHVRVSIWFASHRCSRRKTTFS